MVTDDTTYFESKPNFGAADAWKWINTYHFLFIDENKKILNYSEDEVIFHLEIKGKKVT